MVTGSGSRLIHIHHKLVEMLSPKNFVASPKDGAGRSGFKPPYLGVEARGGLFDFNRGANELGMLSEGTDLKVFDGSLGLGSPKGIGGHSNGPQRIFL